MLINLICDELLNFNDNFMVVVARCGSLSPKKGKNAILRVNLIS